ncbi:hypothetical protein TrCOL_g6112 [Triparma columacea]|uniref:Uncharacterized protein n=1 Tax=Triparma columacea TaxID=722753 RepID=A0A9W7FXK8_9STRA|nr:hypothetical protein TrCOL_g6112 [Triparma columacea]
MPPFLDDGSVRYVAEGMIEAAKVAGDWVERNEMMIPEGTKETVGEIERSSHVKANEIIHLNGGTVTKRKLRGENRIENLYPDDSNDGNEKAGAMMVKSKKKEKEKEKEKEMVEMEAPEIMKVRKKAKVAAKERPRKLYEDDMDVDGNDDGDGDDKGNSVATSVTAPWGYDSDGDPMTEYQRMRHDKIQRNKAHLEGLGLNKVKDALKAMSSPPPQVPYTSAEKNCIKYAAPTLDTMYPHMTASKRWENVLATYPDIFQNSRSAINLQNQYNKMLTKVGGQAGKLLCVHPSIFEDDFGGGDRGDPSQRSERVAAAAAAAAAAEGEGEAVAGEAEAEACEMEEGASSSDGMEEELEDDAGVGARERAMRVLLLSQALCYKRIERGWQEGRIRDKWAVVKGRIKRMKKEMGERYEDRLKGLKEGKIEKKRFETLRDTQIEAAGHYERLVNEHMIKVMSSRPGVGWGKREELEGQMVGNMEGQWKTFGTQFDEMSKSFELAKLLAQELLQEQSANI